MRLRDDVDCGEPLPTAGIKVEEIRDAEGLERFMREWRRRLRRGCRKRRARVPRVHRAAPA